MVAGKIEEIYPDDNKYIVFLNGKRFVFYGENNRIKQMMPGQIICVYKENGFNNFLKPGEYKTFTATDGSCKKVMWFCECKKGYKNRFITEVNTQNDFLPLCCETNKEIKEGDLLLVTVKDKPKTILFPNNERLYYCEPEKIKVV